MTLSIIICSVAQKGNSNNACGDEVLPFDSERLHYVTC